MSMDTQPRRAPRTALIMLLVGLIGGGAGGLLFSGYLPGLEKQTFLPDADLAFDTPINQSDPGQRTIGQNPGGTNDGTEEPVQIPAADGADDTTVSAPDPLASAALRAILERRAAEEARLRERARLASESPLTPPVTDIRERIRARQDQEAKMAGRGPTGAASDTSDAGRGGAGAAGQLSPDIEGAYDRTPAVSAPPAHLLARGSVIPSVLETALDSDLPGLVRARVSHDVYDTLTGTHVLIPRGAQLVGTYGEIARGEQRRLFVTWTDLRLPDGTPVDLRDFSTLGADGVAGVKGRRSTGLLAALGAAVLFDLAGNATQILTGSETQEDTDLGALLAGATGNATSRVAERYMGHLIDSGPRFRVKAGTIMNVLVEKDMELPAQPGTNP
ncbi:TrbI/VirB10 family protein [Ruegeria atlantica]|uniref:TrbI/VirB10 family protein n=1 Tax=Ruegeria atlantica TaxID=81569 RepID=UPI001479AB4C|nr:TrbI/VirB10 family protein [Ruegeria atlantica]